MMRDTISQRLAALACCCAMLAYAGWTFTATFGDSTTSAEIVRVVLDSPAVARQLAAGTGALSSPLRIAGVDPGTVDAITSEVLSDPRVVDSAAAVSSAHSDLVTGERTIRLELPGPILTAAARDAAAKHGVDPAVVGELPATSIPIPSIAAFGAANRAAARWGDVLGVAAAVLTAAFALAATRSLVTRLLGRWLTFSSVTALFVPLVAAWITKSSGSTLITGATGIASVWRSRTQPVLIAALCVGVALWAVSAAVLNGRAASLWSVRRDRLGTPVAPARTTPPNASPGPRTRQAAVTDPPDAAGHELPEFDPWVDGTLRGGRYSTTR